MNHRKISTRFSARISRRSVRRTAPRLAQFTVDSALCAFFDAARAGDSPSMVSSVAVVASARARQVQSAMLFVQRERCVSRADLLTVLIGDERENHSATSPARHGGDGAWCDSRRD